MAVYWQQRLAFSRWDDAKIVQRTTGPLLLLVSHIQCLFPLLLIDDDVVALQIPTAGPHGTGAYGYDGKDE